MKTKNQLAYFESVIKNDRCNLKEDFAQLFLSDLKVLLSEYYDIVSGVNLNAIKNGGEYCVEIKFNAKSPKYFSKLQN